MSLFAGLDEIVKRDEPMTPHTWFRLGGPARYFIEPKNQTQLLDVIHRCRQESLPIYVLGRGSNLLVADEGVNGAVVHLTRNHFGKITVNGNVLRAEAGADLRELVQYAARHGLSGMEALVGIPGSIGGAVRMNAGGRFGDIGSTVEKVRLIDSSGFEFEREQKDIFFGYRTTNILAMFIMEAEFSLVPGDPEKIGKLLKEIWMLKKNSQPMSTRNAGCVFKNPRALSAGALIDKVGLKGTRIGGAVISERHANFILAEDGATSTDILKLIDLMREKVRQRFEVELELELEIWR